MVERSLESLLSWWETSGVDVPDMPVNVPRRVPMKSSSEKPLGKATKPQTRSQNTASSAPAQSAISLVKKVSTLDQLRGIIAEFDAGEISDHARQSVFSRGNPEAEIMVIGEAPGRDEDIQGKPFVGRSGQLLDRVFASIGLNEDTLYITNVINWRPPGNRNPTPEEIATCLPFIHKHMELIAPRVIVLVGGVSFSALTGMTGIMKNRGQWTSLKVGDADIPTLPIYHPAFLLRQPTLKKDAWLDMLSLRAKIESL